MKTLRLVFTISMGLYLLPIFSQPQPKHSSYYTGVLGYRYIEASGLNQILRDNSLPEVFPHMSIVGVAFTKRIKNHLIGGHYVYSGSNNTSGDELYTTSFSSTSYLVFYGFQTFRSQRWCVFPSFGLSYVMSELQILHEVRNQPRNDFSDALTNYSTEQSTFKGDSRHIQIGLQGYYSVGSGFTLGFQTGYQFLLFPFDWENGDNKYSSSGVNPGGFYFNLQMGLRYSKKRTPKPDDTLPVLP